jgi:hypothetical protein
VEAVVSATSAESHHPDFVEYEDLELTSLVMFGKDWTRAELVSEFGQQGADALEKHIFYLAEDWEDED